VTEQSAKKNKSKKRSAELLEDEMNIKRSKSASDLETINKKMKNRNKKHKKSRGTDSD